MLSMLFSLIVVVVTLAILLMNVGMTTCFAGSPPQGERAMGLVVPFFGMIGAILLMTLAALVACFRVSSSGFGTIHTSPMLSGFILVALTFGATLSAAIAFMMWCEPPGRTLRAVMLPVELLLGVFGPIALATWLLVAMWNTKESITSHATYSTAMKALFWCVVVLAVTGFGFGGMFAWHTMSRQVTARVSGIKHEVQQLFASGGHGLKPIAKQIELEMADASADAPLTEFVGMLPKTPRHRKLNEKARTLVIERALTVPHFDESLRECMIGRDYIYRQGAAELLRFAPEDQFDARKDEWGEALILGIKNTAIGVYCRPAWLSEHFDLNPDPMDHVASLLAATKRFESWSGYPRLQAEFQEMANATSQLKEDKHLPKFLKMLAEAGYMPKK